MGLILVYVHEAHSSAWPRALAAQPEPHRSMEDRMKRVKLFQANNPECPYSLYVDTWADTFEQRYRAWPDKYAFITTEDRKLIQTSTYGKKRDALIDEDVIVLARKICAE